MPMTLPPGLRIAGGDAGLGQFGEPDALLALIPVDDVGHHGALLVVVGAGDGCSVVRVCQL